MMNKKAQTRVFGSPFISSSFSIHHSAFSSHLPPLFIIQHSSFSIFFALPMLTPAPPKSPPRRRRRRVKRSAVLPPPPPAQVLVTSVTIHSTHEVDFSFDHPVTSVGGAG